MSVRGLLAEVARSGGAVVLRPDGRTVAVGVPDGLIEQLRSHREEVIALLRQSVSSSPHRPQQNMRIAGYRRSHRSPGSLRRHP